MTQEPEKHRTNTSRDDAIHRAARRAFLTGSLASVPVITTLASRPAWAGCGLVSVMDSIGHNSHAGATDCAGMTAAWWLANPPTSGELDLTFLSVFGAYIGVDGLTIGEALALTDPSGSDALLRETAAAWLNARAFPTFGYSPPEVITHYQVTGLTEPALLLAAFQTMNNASTA